jgi:alpha-beta hydrolase superfamily lysophospholipase
MAPVSGHTADEISFAARDRVQVFADYHSAGSKAKPLILLFHQAGSNRGEYATIGPTLATLGFNALAIDQRSGGNAWGRTNETVKHLGKSTDYGEALLDLEAALQWAKSTGQTESILVWGSSYSAALAFLLAAEHQDEIKAILAFSPGEYLRGSSTVRKAAAQVSIPKRLRRPNPSSMPRTPPKKANSSRRSRVSMDRRHCEKTRTQMEPKKIGRRSNNFSLNSPPRHPHALVEPTTVPLDLPDADNPRAHLKLQRESALGAEHGMADLLKRLR